MRCGQRCAGPERFRAFPRSQTDRVERICPGNQSVGTRALPDHLLVIVHCCLLNLVIVRFVYVTRKAEMSTSRHQTVRDLLRSALPMGTRVIAGNKGLNRVVTWTS